jgi:predicted MPP superfamily phosphohydrolase
MHKGKVGTTPADAKEKSVIKIKNLTKADIVTVFGTLTDGLTTQTFSKPHNFSKQHKMGSKKIDVRSAHMTFSTSTSNCKIKFNVHTIDNDSGNFFGRDEAGDY